METEARIEGLLRSGDLPAAAAEAIEAYGAEVLGFLVTFLRHDDDASEVFSQACEDLWTGLARFQGRSSLRTWFYTLARHAAARFRRSPHRDRRRHLPLSQMSDVADAVRSRTLPHLRSEAKDRFAAIRDALEEDDRALLVLRIDRQMSWDDIARIYSVDDDSLARVSAGLRKRFQLIKEEIRRRAQKAGLIPGDEP